VVALSVSVPCIKPLPNGTEQTLYTFTGGRDGSNPDGVALNADGTIVYGTMGSAIFEIPAS
jgi:hypothetical protein